jgi:hypothetical protein
MLKEIPKSSISVRPIKLYKEWFFGNEDYEVHPYFAKQSSSLFNPDTDETTRDGIYKRLLYQSVSSSFYRNSDTASILTEVGFRNSYASTDERMLVSGSEIALIVLNQDYYGEGIKVGSVVLNHEGVELTDDSHSNLIDSGSNIKGNIFYDRGMVILTKDVVSGSTLTDFSLSYRSTQTIYENEIFIPVFEGEFNVSTNPTAYNYDSKNIKLYDIESSHTPGVFGGFGDYDYSSSIDPTGSYLVPFITTIGLYDDDNNMVAVAKLPQPIKCLPDYPVNFLVRFDT